jgi:hypothetical protein
MTKVQVMYDKTTSQQNNQQNSTSPSLRSIQANCLVLSNDTVDELVPAGTPVWLVNPYKLVGAGWYVF